MTAESWVGIVAQVPLVAAFIWFSLEMQKRNEASLARRDEMYEKRNAAIVDALSANTLQITRLTEIMTKHDAKIDAGR